MLKKKTDAEIEFGPSSGAVLIGCVKVGFVFVGESPDESGRYDVSFRAFRKDCDGIGFNHGEFSSAFATYVSQL